MSKKKTDQKNQKKETKMTNKSGYQRRYFTKTSTEDLRERLESALNRVADTYNVRYLNVVNLEKEAQLEFGPDFFARDWSWNENFFKEYLFKAEALENSQWKEQFQSWWYDQLMMQLSVMVYNLVDKTVKETWKTTNTYPGAQNLSRKVRNSMESVADHFATLEVENFEKGFK